MTDNEIIKALELCLVDGCDICPCSDEASCVQAMADNALDLIKKQQAEIDRLKMLFNDQQEIIADSEWIIEYLGKLHSRLRAEAIKEFADKLKANRPKLNTGEQVFYIRPEEVDNLVKEMVGADDV